MLGAQKKPQQQRLQPSAVTRVESSILLNPTLTPSNCSELFRGTLKLSNVLGTEPQQPSELPEFLPRPPEEPAAWGHHREADKSSPEVPEEFRLLGTFEIA